VFTVEPDPDRFASAVAGVPPGVPVTMLNLLRFREVASYRGGDAGPEVSGREAYTQRYAVCAARHVQAVGGEVVWAGSARGTLVAPAKEDWDEVLLVRYPSVAAFTDMVSSADYLACARHRTAALLDSRLVATVQP